MNDLLLSASTKAAIDAYLQRPAHALGIVGSPGAGKRTLAYGIAEELLGVALTENSPYFKLISPEKNSISIEQAREIIQFTKLKTTGTSKIRRVIIIDSADKMTREAQNAVLKVIEEPPEDTAIILTVSSEQAILPTILSRLQTLVIATPLQDAAEAYFVSKGFEVAAITKAYVISNGAPGLMQAILGADDDHPLLEHIAQAKTVLQSDTFQRLVMIDEIIKSKQTNNVLYGLQQIAHSALIAGSKANNSQAVIRWQAILQEAYTAREQLAQNTQAKLVLTNLLIRI